MTPPLVITRFGKTLSCYDESYPYSCAITMCRQHYREISKKPYEPVASQIKHWVEAWCSGNCAGEWSHHAPYGLSFREPEDYFLFLMNFPVLRD